MITLFTDKLSSQSWSRTLHSTPESYAALSRWLADTASWDEGPLPPPHPDPKTHNRPDSVNQSGDMCILDIRADWNSIDEHGIAREFSWLIYQVPVDRYGVPRFLRPDSFTRNRADINAHPDYNVAVIRINGGLINHGTPDEPRWSSHT
jgi:hypothetical protein